MSSRLGCGNRSSIDRMISPHGLDSARLDDAVSLSLQNQLAVIVLQVLDRLTVEIRHAGQFLYIEEPGLDGFIRLYPDHARPPVNEEHDGEHLIRIAVG